MSGNWAFYGSLATILMALAAITTLIIQTRLTRLTIGTELLWKLEARFCADRIMLDHRRRAAQALLAHEPSTELDEVLTFLELVGLYMRRRMVDKELVWNMFCPYAVYYCHASADYIVKVRSTDFTLWENLDYLATKMLEMDSRKRRLPKDRIRPTEPEVNEFLQDERGLI